MSNFLNFAGNQGVTFKNHGTGGGTSFTLDKAASTNSVLVTIGGVMQATGTDYTVSGTTITTTTSVTSGIEVLSWIIHKPGTAPVIQDNSIDSDHYVDGSIDSAHIGNDQIDSQHYAAASIDNEHLADDAVGVAELSATGTASSSTFLRGDNSWAAAGGGKILQVVSAVKNSDQDSLTSTSYADTGGLVASLTPAASSSKVLVLYTSWWGQNNHGTELTLGVYRDINGGGYSGLNGSYVGYHNQTDQGYQHPEMSISFLDSPSTTSQVNYKIYYKTTAGTWYNTYTGSVGGALHGSNLTIMEIGA